MTCDVIDEPPTPSQAGVLGRIHRPRTPEVPVTAYAIAHLTDVDRGPEIVEYLQRIDATLAPFEGRFLVHGDPPEALEGEWEGALIVIAFPSRRQARDWYDSPAYRAILPLRTRNARGIAVLVDGVDADHVATDVLT